jgi:phosphatidylglycerophosphate synthase
LTHGPGNDMTERLDRKAVIRSVIYYTLCLEAIQLAIAWLLISHPGPAALSRIYMILAVPWTILVGLVLCLNVHLLYTDAGRIIRRLNMATRVTLIRVLSIPLVVALIVYEHPEAAALVFIGAALTDWLDGFLARRMGDVTQLGRVADPSIDALFCGITILTMAWVWHFAIWVAVLVVIRYILLVAGAGVIKWRLGFLDVQATFFGRMFYFVQYVLLITVLLFSTWGGVRILIPMLGLLQVAVIVQLIVLGRVMLKGGSE